MILRPARDDDAPAIAIVWYDAWLDGHIGHVPDELVAIRTPESFGPRAAERVGRTTVAVVDDEVAGFVTAHDDEVEQVFVASPHRGTGMAAALLAEGERLVAANGHDRAWLAVAPGNARARRFYERQGWTDEGLFDYGADGSIAVPCHRYVRNL